MDTRFKDFSRITHLHSPALHEFRKFVEIESFVLCFFAKLVLILNCVSAAKKING